MKVFILIENNFGHNFGHSFIINIFDSEEAAFKEQLRLSELNTVDGINYLVDERVIME